MFFFSLYYHLLWIFLYLIQCRPSPGDLGLNCLPLSVLWAARHKLFKVYLYLFYSLSGARLLCQLSWPQAPGSTEVT